MSRQYTRAEAIDAATKAAILGTVRLAVERLGVPESTLRRWLKQEGYRVRQGRISDPPPGADRSAAAAWTPSSAAPPTVSK